MNTPFLNNENELIEQIAVDNRQAFTVLYNQLYPRLYSYLLIVTRSEDLTDEIIQEVFLKLWIKRKTLSGVRSIADYVFRMAKNRVFDVKRRENLVITQPYFNDDDHGEHAEDAVLNEVLLNEYISLARRAINALSAKRREIFLLNAQNDLTAKQIAEQLSMTLSAVKKHLYEADHFIKDYLRKNGDVVLSLCYYLIVSRYQR